MSSLRPRLGHWLLRCPLCKFGFTAAVGTLVCRNGHSFDLARQGYVNLLSSGRRRPAAGGDGPLQLHHRGAFLETGHIDAVTTAIVDHITKGTAEPPIVPRRIIDAGAGTGHHLDRIAATLHRPVIGLGLDISKEAARKAARRWPTLAFAVADLWADWPVQDAVIDLVVSMFAPKNFRETARVLRPDGWLVVAYPGPEHLMELSDRFRLLRQHEVNQRRYADMAARFVGPTSIVRVRTRAILDPAAVRAVILMGPSARHVDPSILDVGPDPLAVTFDINLLFARKTETGRSCAEGGHAGRRAEGVRGELAQFASSDDHSRGTSAVAGLSHRESAALRPGPLPE